MDRDTKELEEELPSAPLPLEPTQSQLLKSHATLAKILDIMRKAGNVTPPPTIETAPEVVEVLFVELSKSRDANTLLRKTLALELVRER